ncbi:MAG TPA: ECF transporter S component [Gaiellaceae bacterium]|nr:ECF transporter S component [Gaiellaceae bacterium]
MSSSWFRAAIAAVATIAVLVIGLALLGSFDTTANPDTGLVAGSNSFMLVLAVSLLVGFIVYAGVEFAQTRRLDSIARQFDTRTIVLMPIAIAINIVLGQTVGTALKIPLYLDSIGTILVGALAGPIPGALTGLLANLIWTFVLAGTPFGSPYAWPFAIVAAEIGLLSGVFGYYGFFRSRPNTSAPKLVGGLFVAAAILFGLVFYGVIPFYKGNFTFFGASPTDGFFTLVAYVIAVGLVVAVVALAVQLLVKRDLGVAFIVVCGAICGVVSALISAPISAFVFGGVTGSGADILVAAFQQAGSTLEQAVFQQGLLQDPIDKTIEFMVAFLLLQTLSRRFTSRFPQGERAVGVVEA